MSDESHGLEPGSRFGKHLVVRKLGQGGMGEVYEVEHELTGKRHALKLLNKEVTASSGALSRFNREAKVMARLQHPGIVKVDDSGETEGCHWFRMELMEGFEVSGKRVVTLEDYVKLKGVDGRLPPLELKSILTEILDALFFAHEKGLVHRDLKPANILFDGTRLKISDFGLVNAAGSEWVDTHLRSTVMNQDNVKTLLDHDDPTGSVSGTGSRSHAIMGTFEYMSPEQKEIGKVVDARSDLFAVGLIAFGMLTGRKSKVMMKPVSQLGLGLDEAWDEWLIKSIEEDPSDRFQVAREMADDLNLRFAPIGKTGDFAGQEKPPADSSSDRKSGTQESETKVQMPKEGFAFLERSSGNKMLWCQPGAFMMGSPWDEAGRGFDEIQQEVSLSKGFWLCEYSVSQKQWEESMGTSPSLYKGDSLPLDTVSWDEAVDFCSKLTERERKAGQISSGMEYCLPTEAQWEYACRAGTKTPFATGHELTGDQANIDGEGTTPVDSYKPNPWGFSDMHGNVYEWCSDWYGKYPASPVSDPTGPKDGQARVRRGGHWGYGAEGARSAFRRKLSPDQQIPGYLGFRVSLQIS
jgi:formylglycine-generating enzyme required for sulfatase activity